MTIPASVAGLNKAIQETSLITIFFSKECRKGTTFVIAHSFKIENHCLASLELAGSPRLEHFAQSVFISAELTWALTDSCWVSGSLSCLSLWHVAWQGDSNREPDKLGNLAPVFITPWQVKLAIRLRLTIPMALDR